jgi:deazaflavin-dependent oxidoreductase (nitroreductase family)
MDQPTPPGAPTRGPPGKLGRWFARLPRYLCKARLGRLLGRRFVYFEHTGRTTGLTRETVVEVIRHDAASVDVAAAWGEKADWYRNVVADPSVRLSTGPLRLVPATASVLSEEDAASVFAAYSAAHPRSAKMLRKTLGLPLDDPATMAGAVPVERFTLGG